MEHEHTHYVVSLGNVLGPGMAAHAVALLLPLAVSFGLARAGQVRAAWLLPMGLFVLAAVFVGFGLMLGEDLQAMSGAVTTIVTLAAAGILGGVAGVLLGRRGRT
jgi:hypothetical protein